MSAKWWQAYLDNFAAGKVVAREDVESFHRKLGRWQKAGRSCWEQRGIPRSHAKASVRELTVKELGGVLDGDRGTLCSSVSRRCQTILLSLHVLGMKRVTLVMVQVVLGRWIYCMQLRRPCNVCTGRVLATATVLGDWASPQRCRLRAHPINLPRTLDGVRPSSPSPKDDNGVGRL